MAKIKDDQLQRINQIRQDAMEIASILGELNFQKISIDLLIDEQKKNIADLKKRELEFFEEIKTEYGNGTLNLESGEIT
jgi:coproporphyrinogen III oxidase-like Fe-S oxidoreductase